MAMLEVIIGMIFTFMVLSLLGTTLNELISAWRGWRGFYLDEGLKRLLAYEDDQTIFEKFKNNAFFRQLMQHKAPLRVSRSPAYLSSKNFSSILFNILKKKDAGITEINELIEGLPKNGQLRQVLEQIKDEGYESVEAYRERIEEWFEDIMGQASGWYKRHLQLITIFVGLTIAMVLNADSFQIYNHLTKNSTARQNLAELAESFAVLHENAPVVRSYGDSMAIEDIRKEISEFTSSSEFSQMANILGLGWHDGDLLIGPKSWLVRILGWFVTALAISLGAPFWFDVLKKIVTIRSSGEVKKGKENTPQVVVNTGVEARQVK